MCGHPRSCTCARCEHGIGRPLDGALLHVLSQRIGCCQHPFGATSVAFQRPSGVACLAALGIGLLLEGIIDNDLTIAQKLVVHAFDRRVGCLEGIEGNKAKPLALRRLLISHNVRRFNNGPKSREGIVQQLLVHIHRIEIANKQIGPNVEILPRLLVETGLGHPQRSPIQLYHGKDLHGIVGIGNVQKLNEAISIVRSGQLVFRHVT